MHTCTDIVTTNHVIPQQQKDPLVRLILSRQICYIKIEVGRRHGKLRIIHIKTTHDSPKIPIAGLLKLQIPPLHMPHTPHRTKTDQYHWGRDSGATRRMAARTFPCRVRSQIARRDTQCKKFVRMLLEDP